jgi:ferrous iron transport protein A
MSPRGKIEERLSQVAAGRRARVVGVDAGPATQARLIGMGFVSGVGLEVIRNDMRGPIILGMHRARIGIGRGMADKIHVKTEPASR